MKVKDLMSTNITCVSEKTSVEHVADHMRRNDIGCIPVCDDAGRIKGIITDRDIVIRYLAKLALSESSSINDAASFSSVSAGQIMTSDPITVSPDQNIHDASLLFSAHKIRRLPVTEASRIVGMLSLGDVAVKPVYIDEAGDSLSAISVNPTKHI